MKKPTKKLTKAEVAPAIEIGDHPLKLSKVYGSLKALQASLATDGASDPAPVVKAPPEKPNQPKLTAEKVDIKPEGRGIQAITVYGSRVQVIDLMPGFKDMVLVRIGTDWRTELALRDLVDTDELAAFVEARGGVMPLFADDPGPNQDCYGQTFKECVAEQEQQLATLEPVLDGGTYLRLRKWCTAKNKPCVVELSSKRGRHEVPRGITIMNWLLERGAFINETSK